MYPALQKLQEDFGGRGLCILAFPCNQFAGQEPDDDATIKKFATEKYGATFHLFSKIRVNGPKDHPLYQYLKEALPGGNIGWNFAKFLCDRDGVPIKRYAPKADPNEELRADIEKYLSENANEKDEGSVASGSA